MSVMSQPVGHTLIGGGVGAVVGSGVGIAVGVGGARGAKDGDGVDKGVVPGHPVGSLITLNMPVLTAMFDSG